MSDVDECNHDNPIDYVHEDQNAYYMIENINKHRDYAVVNVLSVTKGLGKTTRLDLIRK